MSIPNAARRIPEAVAGTPIRVVKAESRLPCPHDECDFNYWNTGDRQGKRTPTIEDEFSARDKPCEHLLTTWTPNSDTTLDAALEEAAESASGIFCAIDKQVTLEEDAQLVVIYVEHQTTLGGF